MEKCRKTGSSVRNWITVQLIVDSILWVVVGVPVLHVFLRGTPVERGFFCDDPALSYPYKPSTISVPILIIIGFTISVLMILLVEALNSISVRCRRYCETSEDLLYCVKGYIIFLLGFTIQELLVDTMKNQLGFLRPNFFDVCRPQYNISQCPGYITEYKCTRSDVTTTELRSVRQAFPSGHSSFSMYIAVFFCLYMNDRLNVSYSRLLKFLLQTGLVFLALVCGILRVYNNKHHMSDVIAGFLIGLTVAVAAYKTVGQPLLLGTAENPSRSKRKSHKVCCTCESTNSMETQPSSTFLQTDYSSHSLHSALLDTNNQHKSNGITFSVKTDKRKNDGQTEEV